MNADILDLTARLRTELETPPSIDIRTLPVRFSRLKKMALSPAHYRHAALHEVGEDSLALRIGSGVHAIVLGKPVARYSGRRAGKQWEAFAAEHTGELILNDSEWAESSAMATAISRRKEAASILFDGTTIEQPIDWRFLFRDCRSTPDAFNAYHVAELKTCRTSNPAWFVRDALRLQYHCQLAFYADAIAFQTAVRPMKAYVVAVEKTPPHPVTVLELTERALEQGASTVRLWFEQLLACEAADEWPEYAQSIVPFDVPDFEPTELIINGQRMEID